MLPTTTENDLSAAFVTDNVLVAAAAAEEEEESAGESGIGNSVAETNKPEIDDNNSGELAVNDDNDQAILDDGEQFAAVSSLAESERLTIENNEEAEASDSFNESSEDDATTAAAATQDSYDADDAEVVVPENVESFETHSQQVAPKPREDAPSSDDESDAEKVEMNSEFDTEWASLAEDLANANDKDNELNNDIDVYSSVPVDLSNDIAVNDLAAAQPDFQPDPDAEFVEVDGALMSHSSMPKFEKLSLAEADSLTSYQPASGVLNEK